MSSQDRALTVPVLPFSTYKAPRHECVTENSFSYFLTKTDVVGTQKNHLIEMVLLSTQNNCCKWRVRKYSCFYKNIKLSLILTSGLPSFQQKDVPILLHIIMPSELSTSCNVIKTCYMCIIYIHLTIDIWINLLLIKNLFPPLFFVQEMLAAFYVFCNIHVLNRLGL